MKQMSWKGIAGTLVVAAFLLLTGVVVVGVNPEVAQAQVNLYAPRTVTLLAPTAVTTGTTYSSAPLLVQEQDFARTTNYANGELFVSTGANSTGYLTVTVQASADEAIWTDSTNIVYTSFTTGTIVSTAFPYRVALTGASAAGMVRFPMAGEFTRVKIEVTGSITPTVKMTLRPVMVP